MLRHALRAATVSAVFGAGAFLSMPAASAQDATTTLAPVAADTAAAAPVADTAAPVADPAAAATPAGGVAAGGGFLTNDSGTPVLPIVLVVGAAGAGAAIFVSRRRKA